MRNPKFLLFLILITSAVVMGACGSKKDQPVIKSDPVTLEQIRSRVALALDGNASSDERAVAREAAIRSLLQFLTTADSIQLTKPSDAIL
jgi:hypothetical protein